MATLILSSLYIIKQVIVDGGLWTGGSQGLVTELAILTLMVSVVLFFVHIKLSTVYTSAKCYFTALTKNSVSCVEMKCYLTD